MNMMWLAVVGLIVGGIARPVMPEHRSGGLLATALLGIGGSVLAGVVGRAAGLYASGQGVGFIASVIGAMVLLGFYRWFLARHPAEHSGIDRAA